MSKQENLNFVADDYISSENKINNNSENNKSEKIIVENYGSIKEKQEENFVKINSDEIRVYFYRYIILLLFSFFSLVNGWQTYQYSSINNIISKYYNVSSSVVNLTVIIVMFNYILSVVPAVWMINHKGIRLSLFFANSVTIIGSIVKCLSAERNLFWISFVGQFIASFSLVFIISLPTKISSAWFEHSKVAFATSVCIFGYLLGFAVGFVAPPYIVTSSNDIAAIGDGLKTMYYIDLISAVICLLVCLLLFKECPPTPPSISQQQAIEARDNKKFSHSLKALMTDKNFIYLILTYGFATGVYNALTTIVNQMIIMKIPDGVHIAGIVGFVIVFSGVFSVLIAGKLLDKTHHHKKIILYSYLIVLLTTIVYILAIYFKIISIIYLSAILLGCSFSVFLFVSYEFSAEITYPEPESSSSGIMNTLGQLFGLIMTPIASVMLDHVGMISTNIFLIISLIIGFILIFFMQSDLRRRKAQSNFVNNFD